jgi:outer membrane protein assembly factor BamB
MFAVSSVGAVKWSFAASATITTAAAIASDGTLHFGTEDGYVNALDSKGNLKWRTWVGHPSQLVISNDCLVIVSGDSGVSAIQTSAPLAKANWPMYQHDPQHTGWAGAHY